MDLPKNCGPFGTLILTHFRMVCRQLGDITIGKFRMKVHLLNVRHTVCRIHIALPVQITCSALRFEYSVHNFIPTIFRMQCYNLLSWGVECSWM